MNNPFISVELAKAHQRDLLHEAETDRLLREARTGQSGPHARLLSGIGSAVMAAMSRHVVGRTKGASSETMAPEVGYMDAR